MRRLADSSGQIMLVGAFIMAAILIAIALILNNVIYFNNVSYMGFMDHSDDSDLSIRNLVAQEAINAYNESKDNSNAFNNTMQDVASSLNNITLPQGIRVVISPPELYGSYDPTSTYPSTKFNLTIYTKSSTKTYSISTTHYPVQVSPANVLNCTITIQSNKSELTRGMDIARITVMVVDNNSKPVTGVYVNLHAALGGFYYTNGEAYPVTDNEGYATAYYIPTQLGNDTLSATVGGRMSNNITITNYGICMHNVNIGYTYALNKTDDYYWLNVTVPITMIPNYDFSQFSVDVDVDTKSYVSHTPIIEVHEAHVVGWTNYERHIYINLYSTHKNFDADISVSVTAFCNNHFAKYANYYTFTVSRS